MSSQKGIAHLALIILAVLGIGIGLYLVQTKTNLFPNAQFMSAPTPQTAFHLLLSNNYYLTNKSEGSSSGGHPDNLSEAANSEGSGKGSGMIAPGRSWFYPGEEIRVNVAVSSDIDAANTFSAIINFPRDLLEVVSIQKENNGSGPVPQPYPLKVSPLTNASETTGGVSSSSGGVVTNGCKVSGCNGERCVSEGEAGYSDCAWRDEYACYQKAKCEKQQSGQCGWTKTPELEKCIKSSGIQPRPSFTPTPSSSCMPIPSCIYSNPGCDLYVDPNDPKWCKTPSPSCRPRPACLDSEPRCLLPETSDMCPPTKPSPIPTCKPIPDCVNSNPACQIYIDPTDKSWCPPSPPQNSIQNYFIRFWLPDTGFDNQTGKIILSGGVSGQGVLTIPPSKPVMATIIFKAKKAGEAKLEITDESMILRNSDSSNILVNKNNLTVQIQDPKPVIKGDLDGDGVVGFRDFSILLSKWGSDDKKADINGDGKVNIYDFSILLTNWTGRKR